MAAFKPTPSQEEAMTLRGCAVLVSAGAGSGKTRVLTERVIRAVCGETAEEDLDRFLAISFTRAAAGELRGRLTEALGERLAREPDKRRLRRQSALIPRAHIGTIHSFCAQFLRENCQRANLSPDFRVLDEDRGKAMCAAALERVLERAYERLDLDPDFRLLADTVGEGRDDSAMAEQILALRTRMQAHARPEQWAEEKIRELSRPYTDAGETPWGRELLQQAKGVADYHAARLEEALTLIRAEPKIFEKYAGDFSDFAAALRDLSRRAEQGWDALYAALPLTIPRMPTLTKSPDPILSEEAKARRKKAKEAADKLPELLYAPSARVLEDLAATAKAMSALLRVTLELEREFFREKQSRGLLDFGDLEHLTAQLLTDELGRPTALAREYGARFAEILVDEYQDVSRVQDAIFSALSDGGKKLFLVGDVKQAIYRFRLADPTIFNEKYHSFAERSDARRILLRENFRSRREILDGVNAVFSRCMSEVLGDVTYNEEAELLFGATYYEGEGARPELLLLDLPGVKAPERTETEAAFVAKKIRALVESGMRVTLPDGTRPVEYGDIAILLRSPGSVGGVYRRALLAEGVPVGSAQGSGFFTSQEVSTLLSMLTVLDNPHKDVPLIAVLRSSAFGFTPDDLSRIRAADREHDLFTALEAAAETDARCRDFLSLLHTLRDESADLSAAELVWRLLETLELPALCAAMDDGKRRMENLMALLSLARDYESSGYRGLHRFVLWLSARAEQGNEPETGTAASAVRIVSIHKSKGLEFPVVFLCDAARQFNTSDSSETVLVHPELGLGPKRVDLERRVKYPTIARLAIARRIERESRSEEMRVLYVALTRAKERLFVTASFDRLDKVMERARTRALEPEALLGVSNYAEWLLSACLADGEEHFTLHICDGAAEAAAENAAAEAPTPDPEALKTLEERLGFVYPHLSAVELPSKVTATELKGRTEADADGEALLKPKSFAFPLPRLGQAERPLSAAERGIATHVVLQYMDFQKGRSRAGIQSEIRRLAALRTLSEREAAAVNVSAIERLFASELGQTMLRAQNVRREFRFSLLLDAGRLYPGAEGEELLLQGVVDCCLEEDGLVIIDYKTDRVRGEEEIRARAESYRGQLLAYAEALESILRKPVRRCLLFFLQPGATVELSLQGPVSP